jgi:hypothetical protein
VDTVLIDRSAIKIDPRLAQAIVKSVGRKLISTAGKLVKSVLDISPGTTEGRLISYFFKF